MDQKVSACDAGVPNGHSPKEWTTIEELARFIARWHGQKMIFRNRDCTQTVASSRGFGHWGDASDRYADRHWQEYTAVAEQLKPFLPGDTIEEDEKQTTP